MAMPNEKSGLSSEEYSSMLAKAKKHGGYWNRFMKGFAFPSEKSAKDFLAETGNKSQAKEISTVKAKKASLMGIKKVPSMARRDLTLFNFLPMLGTMFSQVRQHLST